MATSLLSRAIVNAPWCAQADAECARSGFFPAVLEVRRDFPTAALMRDGKRVGTLSYQVRGEEYFVAFIAGDAGQILAEFHDVIADHARGFGCTVARCTTERPGLLHRLTETHGWAVSAVILEKKLT